MSVVMTIFFVSAHQILLTLKISPMFRQEISILQFLLSIPLSVGGTANHLMSLLILSLFPPLLSGMYCIVA